MNFHLSLPVFLFRDYHDLRGKIAPVLFSLNYSPDGIGIFSSFLPATNGKTEVKGLGHSLQDISIRSYLRYKSKKGGTRRRKLLVAR